MRPLNVQQAAARTGWSPRMLRYLEQVGLVVPPRSTGGYRVYGAVELQRLRSLRELIATGDVALSDVAFAKRLRDDPKLGREVDAWLEAAPHRLEPPVSSSDWLRFEQDKSRRLLASATHAA
jgi:DNA-binding transcriptional MerR regulator